MLVSYDFNMLTYLLSGFGPGQYLHSYSVADTEGVLGVRLNPHHRLQFLNRQGLLPVVSSEFTLKSLLPVNWQQRIYVKIAAAS